MITPALYPSMIDMFKGTTESITDLGGSSLTKVKDHTCRGHGDSVDQLCWHPTHPDLLVTAAGDKTVRMWDARAAKSVATVTTKGEYFHHMASKTFPSFSW